MRSNKLTYSEQAINLAIKHNQPNTLKFLHAIGCPIKNYHLHSAFDLLNKYTVKDIKELFEYLVKNGAKINTIIKEAAIADDEQIIKDIIKIDSHYITAFKEEKSANNLVEYAIKNKAIRIINSLLSQQKKLGSSFDEMLEKHKEDCRENLALPLLPLKKSDFIYADGLEAKALALLLEYYHQKKTTPENDHKVYFALGLENLIHAIDLFIKSSEQDLTLLYAFANSGSMGGHRKLFRLEKYKDKIYIILMDSYLSEENKNPSYRFDDLIDQLILKHDKSKIVLCQNLTNQQTDSTNCSHFALKNISKLLTTPCLAKEIETNHVIERVKYNDINVIYYRIPARFMNVAQSHDNLEKYIANNKSEDLQAIRKNKDNKIESLKEYAYHQREGFHIKTPGQRENRHYNRLFKDEHVPQYIPDNLTIDYFANKHKEYVVPTLFNKLNADKSKNKYQEQSKLREIIRGRDASLLTLSSSNKLIISNTEEAREQPRPF